MTDAFVSYSWDSDSHKAWTRDLSARLRSDGIDVRLDQWELVPGDQLPEFMERAVRESNYVLIVCTRKYKDKSDRRIGGVGYEGDIMSAEVYTERNQRKFIPILREAPWDQSAPTWLKGKYYIDLSASPYSEPQYEDLLNTLMGTRPKAPPLVPGRPNLAKSPQQSPVATPSAAFEPIRIAGVIVDQIGTPRGNGTPGSALYRVPFRLSRTPPRDWAASFIQIWDHPPRFTTMHRPGIASVVGDTVILDGTTIEEVRRYHRDTLVLAASEANKQYAAYLQSQAPKRERELKRIEDHRRDVEEKAKRIKFDDE